MDVQSRDGRSESRRRMGTLVKRERAEGDEVEGLKDKRTWRGDFMSVGSCRWIARKQTESAYGMRLACKSETASHLLGVR